MRNRLLLGVAAATAAAVVVPVAALAEGSDPHARATFIGAIQESGKTATLKASYRCGSGKVLWVSAKQSASGNADPRLVKEGSSKVAAAWLESHRNGVTCNGKSHTATFRIDTVEKGSKGALKPGKAWVQFCVTKGDDLVLSKSGWVSVS